MYVEGAEGHAVHRSHIVCLPAIDKDPWFQVGEFFLVVLLTGVNHHSLVGFHERLVVRLHVRGPQCAYLNAEDIVCWPAGGVL